MTVDEIISQVVKNEGGYTNNPHDKGGETKYGITAKTAARHGYTGPMIDLPLDKAVEIYKSEYWKYDAVAELHPDLAFRLMDFGVTAGPGTAIETLQTALNVLTGQVQPVDGVIGPKTVQSLKQVMNRSNNAPRVLLGLVRTFQVLHYANIVEKDESQQTFIYGWLDRCLR